MRKRFFSKLAIVMSTALAVSGCFCPIDKAFVNAETIQDEDDSYYDDDSDYDDSYDDSTDDSYDDSTDDSYDDCYIWTYDIFISVLYSIYYNYSTCFVY